MRMLRPATSGRVERETGSVTLVAGGVLFIACILCLATVDLGRALLARARAQTAADAAALAAAHEIAIPTDAQPADVARAFAERNGATLASCDCNPGSDEAVVEVTISVPFVLLGPDRTVVGTARAVIGPP